jgi:hypothetical protein
MLNTSLRYLYKYRQTVIVHRPTKTLLTNKNTVVSKQDFLLTKFVTDDLMMAKQVAETIVVKVK